MDFTNLTKCLDSFLDLGIPGYDCSVYLKGKEVYRHMNGYADIENKIPISTDTIYGVWSCTKVVTCTAALMLYEQGKFLLDDPLSNYMPEFTDMKVLNVGGMPVPAKNPIRIQDLFTMSAGFTYNTQSANMKAGVEATGGRCGTREMMKYLAKDPLVFEPGTLWLYSLCHDCLAALVEVLSGMRFSDFVQKNIFEPLGITDAAFHLTPEQEERLAPTYNYDWETKSCTRIPGKPSLNLGPDYDSGGGGLFCTTEAYAKFVNGLATGKLLSRATIDLMRTNFLNDAQMQLFSNTAEPGVRKPNERAGYGYGLGVRTMVDKAKGGSNGPIGEFGWGGAVGTYLIVDPENELAVFYAQHTMRPPAEYTRSRVRNVVYACISK